MSELNEFLKVISEAKKEKKDHIDEVKVEMDDFFKMVAEVKKQDPKQQLINKVKANVAGDIGGLFEQLKSIPRSINVPNIPEPIVEQIEELVEEVQSIEEIETLVEVAPVETIDAIEQLANAMPKQSFQQPEVPKVNPEFKAIADKLKFLEQWVAKISAAGPGGGEVNLRWLDDVARETIADGRWLKYDDSRKKFVFDEINPYQVVNNVTEVTSTYYEVHPDDYYIGVNNTSAPVTIVLPESTNSGRTVIIKDEDGDAEIYPITVQGLVDNDPEGFIIQINNGAVQLIYRAGCWRIV